MISFEDHNYELDEDESHVTAVIEANCPTIGWSIEINSLDPDETEEDVGEDDDDEDGFYYEPLLARLYFETPLDLDWKRVADTEWTVDFKLGEDLRLEPNDPATVWKGEAYLPLKNRVRIALADETSIQVDWECEARDQLIENFTYDFTCHAPVSFTGVHVRLSDPTLKFDSARSFGELVNNRPAARSLLDKAQEAMRYFFEVAEFDEPNKDAGGYFYPLRRFKGVPKRR